MTKAIILFLALCVGLFAQAQDNQSQFKKTVMGFSDSITTASNWNVHVEAVYNDTIKKVGVKEGFDYLISPGMYSTLSVCEFNGSAFGLSGNFGIKQHWTFFKGSVGITTAEKVGVVTCLSGQTFGSITIPGKSVSSGQFGGVIGSDIVIDLPNVKYAPNILLGYEKWSLIDGNFFSVGLHWPLGSIL